jgi:glutathione-regulated potassium-efflux system protein KefB
MQPIVPISPPPDGAALVAPIVFLAAAVIAVPIFRKLKLGSVIGYLAAGIAIGPKGLAFFSDADAVLAFAELGVVMLLFIIGLELKPTRLWSMRKDILGLGLLQLLACGAALAAIAYAAGLGARGAVVAGLGLALSSTAFAAPLMEERGELTATYGQRAFAILLMQDVAIVPLLALVALIAPGEKAPTGGFAQTLAILAAVAIVVLVARYVLNPLFRILANSNAREIMTAAALLVVLGAALIMELAGLSMAMGAFLAGVLLAESSFRHELEADIEPFRGLLLGLFFIAVGMGIDLDLVARNLAFVVVGVLILMTVKAAIVYALARASGSPHGDAIRIAGVLAQGGEFAFVLFGAAATDGVVSSDMSNLLVATVTVSLALTPLAFGLANRWARPRAATAVEPETDFSDAKGRVITIGFGRFGQVVAQFLMSQGIEVTAIDHNVEQIRAAARFGFQVYYGDGTRLDVLRAAGADNAALIALCVVKENVALRIVDLVQQHFPLAKLYVRSRDRRHTLDLLKRNVDYQIRETYESAVAFGTAALEALGIAPEVVRNVEADMRRLDEERLALQLAEGLMAGAHLMHTKPVQPEPLTQPKRPARALNPEAEAVTRAEEAAAASTGS